MTCRSPDLHLSHAALTHEHAGSAALIVSGCLDLFRSASASPRWSSAVHHGQEGVWPFHLLQLLSALRVPVPRRIPDWVELLFTHCALQGRRPGDDDNWGHEAAELNAELLLEEGGATHQNPLDIAAAGAKGDVECQQQQKLSNKVRAERRVRRAATARCVKRDRRMAPSSCGERECLRECARAVALRMRDIFVRSPRYAGEEEAREAEAV